AALDGAERAALIAAMADQLDAQREAILAANAEDVARGEAGGLSAAMLDRLRLDPPRLAAIAAALREVAAQADPLDGVT
ncbi:gamma-glutamyl-phosphate reductase, partial [Salinisphaera sp. USBA-960]|nr:gamma-glutamyl-phosphate reductase [Salifodinibacter halophilus]